MGNLISKMNFSVISTKNNKKQEYTTINQNAGNEVLFTTMIQDMANDYSEEESSGTHKDGGGGLRTELNKISTRNEVQESYYLKGHFYPKASDFNKVENTDPTDKFTKKTIFVRSLNKPYAKEGYSSYQLSYYWSSGGYLTCLANSAGINYRSHKQNKSCNYLNGKDVLKVTLFNGKFIAFATTGIYSTNNTNLVFDNQEEFKLKLTISGFDSSFNKHYINFDVFGNTLYASYSAAGLYSSKNGDTWSKVTLPNSITSVDNVFNVNNKIWLNTNNGLWYSSDGNTWNQKTSAVGDKHNVTCKSGNNVIIACGNNSGNGGMIWIIDKYGDYHYTTYDRHILCLYKVGDTILSGELGNTDNNNIPHLYYSNNDGETWNDSGFTVSSGGAITDIIYNPNTELLSLATTDGLYQMSLPLSDSGIHYDPEYLKAIEILRKIDSGKTITSEEVANNYILSDCLLRWLGYDPIYTNRDFTKLLPNKYSLTGIPSSGKYTSVVKWGDYIADNYDTNKIKDGMRPYIKFNTSYDTTYKPVTILKTENMRGGGGISTEIVKAFRNEVLTNFNKNIKENLKWIYNNSLIDPLSNTHSSSVSYSNNPNIPFYCGNNDAFEKLNEISNSENLYTLTMLINIPELNCFDNSYGTWVINYKDDTINVNGLWGGSVLNVITRWEEYQPNLLNYLIKYNKDGKKAENFKYPLVSSVISKGNGEHGHSIVFADYNYNILITSDYLKPYIGRIKLEY